MKLRKPFNEYEFITKYNNYKKIEKKMNLDNFKKNIPLITHYYLGLV